MQQEINNLRNKLVMSQSRAFELVAQLTEERDTARVTADSQREVLNHVIKLLGLTTPTPDDIYAAVSKLNKPKPVKKLAKKTTKKVAKK